MEFLKEDEFSIMRSLHHDSKFYPDSFDAVSMGVGLTFIVGIPRDESLIQQLINPEKVIVQSVKFMKPEWDIESALLWLKENQKDFTNYKSKKIFKADLKEIKGVEIFSAGTWNGDTYTTKDLDAMVEAFKETENTIRPFLKLGHSDKQEILANEGLPAAGWIGRIYRKGEKLLADFIDIPSKIFELIENKSYRSVSSEIYFNLNIKDKDYNMLLGAVALLGAETPGVMNLSDILSRFGMKAPKAIKTFADASKSVTIKTYSIEKEINLKNEETSMPKTEKEIALELKLQATQAKLDQAGDDAVKFKADLNEAAEQLKKSNDDKLAAEKQVFESEKEKKEIELNANVDKLVGEKLISKSMRPFALALLGDKVDKDTKKYNFKSGDKDVSLDRLELIKEFATLAKTVADVNFDENSEAGEPVKVSNEDEIEKYALENEVTYSEAYRQFNAGKLTTDKPHIKEN